MFSGLTEPRFLIFALLMIFVEYRWRRRARDRDYDVAGAAASLGLAFVQPFAKGLAALLTIPVYLALQDASPFRLPMDDWRVWVAGFFAVEFAYYWMHRWSHTVRWMWATHAVHHSANEFTLPAALRLGLTNVVSGSWLFFTPLVLIGFDPLLVVTLVAANLQYQFLLHTEFIGRLGPLEWAFNTPSHHRVHHAVNPRYLDKNFGGVLIVFDRLFGSFAPEDPAEPCRYGLTRPLRSNNPIVIAFHEWVRLGRDVLRSRNAQTTWRALFGRP